MHSKTQELTVEAHLTQTMLSGSRQEADVQGGRHTWLSSIASELLHFAMKARGVDAALYP
eukprot:2803421-Rhodomonas_salina.2